MLVHFFPTLLSLWPCLYKNIVTGGKISKWDRFEFSLNLSNFELSVDHFFLRHAELIFFLTPRIKYIRKFAQSVTA